jgi:hypothetical protein
MVGEARRKSTNLDECHASNNGIWRDRSYSEDDLHTLGTRSKAPDYRSSCWSDLKFLRLAMHAELSDPETWSYAQGY